MQVDTKAIRRRISQINAEIKRSQRNLERATKAAAKSPNARSKRNRDAMNEIRSSTERLQQNELAKNEILALLDKLKACTNSCGSECETARTRGARIAEKAPAPQKRIKRAPAPSSHEQKMIAQAHWWALMRERDRRLNLPPIEVPDSTWQPDGERQISAYRKHWRSVFDDFWWEQADVAISDLGIESDDARRVAIAADPKLFAEYERSNGNIDSLLNRIRKGQIELQDDPFFFPRKSNPREKKTKKKAGTDARPRVENRFRGFPTVATRTMHARCPRRKPKQTKSEFR